MEQLSIEMPDLDMEKSRDAAERALDKYRFYLLRTPDRKLPKVTQTFSIIPPTETNENRSSTEDAAVYNIDQEIERERYIKMIWDVVNRLSFMERGIIIHRYMKREKTMDYEVYGDFNMSERDYYRIKREALLNLAYGLGVEVYKEAVV